MIKAQEILQFTDEALHLCIAIMDRYISLDTEGQLESDAIAAAALLIAIDACQLTGIDFEIVYLSLSYKGLEITRNDLSAAKRRILLTLEDEQIQLSYSFLSVYGKCSPLICPNQSALARYVLELSLMESQFVNVPPSKMAAATLLWTLLYSRGHVEWEKSLESFTNHSREELMPIAKALNYVVATAPTQKFSIFEKYRLKSGQSIWENENSRLMPFFPTGFGGSCLFIKELL